MKILNTLLDYINQIINMLFPNSEDEFNKLKIFENINIENKKTDEIIKIFKEIEHKIANYVKTELYKMNQQDYIILYNKIESYIRSNNKPFELTPDERQQIYEGLFTIKCYFDNEWMDKSITWIRNIFLHIIMIIIVSIIKHAIKTYMLTIKYIQDVRKDTNLKTLIMLRNGILNIIVYKIIPIMLYIYKHDTSNLPNAFKYPPTDINELDTNKINNIIEYLKEEIEKNMFNYISGFKKYNMESINNMINVLKGDNCDKLCNPDEAKELLNFLQDPHVQNMLLDGEIDLPQKNVIKDLNSKILNNSEYVTLNIMNELLDTNIGKKLMQIFTGSSSESLSNTILGAENKINNGINLNNNSFGFKDSDIVLITVMECLDAIRACANNSKNCCVKTPSLTVNVNTPITKLSVDGTEFKL
ncbi:hypothetical protein MseVgp184 [Melanoplus sanguinipes entomopoxvirus]|uniref:Uncharacterized protein n=1 Tax=Melanoplus sanguinipes entomopoxvirus TaxID=83191 RepID=Q9YVQ8_MSEPV|nr:hypothetical protein MseVgp184 [Melanoplus sanguinipes entomopoxvirus]AAC97692.1 ORF MSV184 hypothetical protein [Melanoplus sanguinipes entomopoxvirus 'O']